MCNMRGRRVRCCHGQREQRTVVVVVVVVSGPLAPPGVVGLLRAYTKVGSATSVLSELAWFFCIIATRPPYAYQPATHRHKRMSAKSENKTYLPRVHRPRRTHSWQA